MANEFDVDSCSGKGGGCEVDSSAVDADEFAVKFVMATMGSSADGCWISMKGGFPPLLLGSIVVAVAVIADVVNPNCPFDEIGKIKLSKMSSFSQQECGMRSNVKYCKVI